MRTSSTHYWSSLLSAVALAASAAACEERPRASARPDASEPPPEPPPPPAREGCARTGSLDALEGDVTCIVKQASDDRVRAVYKQLDVTLELAPAEVMTGGTAQLVLTIKNRSLSEQTLLLEARPRSGPRPDWSRISGVPEPHPTALERPHLFAPAVTTDSAGRDVDAVPTVGAAPASPPPSTVYAVRLRPGGKLTRTVSWWALRIPAPPPVIKDEAGHRYYPKTTAQPLPPGEYTVALDVPFFGLTREERKATAHVQVTRATLPDGGLRRH